MAVQQITWANQCAFMRGKGGKRGRMGCHCAQGPPALSERRGPHPSSSFHPAPAAARRAGTSESAEERARIPGGAEEGGRPGRSESIHGAARARADAADRGPGEPAGALLQAPDGALQEGHGAQRPLRRRGRAPRLLPRRQGLPVLIHQNQDDSSSDLQSRLREITTWSLQNNVEESDAYELEKLEDLLRNALRDTRSKKIQKLAEQTNGGSTSAAQNCNGANIQEQGKE